MTDYQRARYALEADWYAQQAADQVERIIIDAIHGRYDDLWLLVPCPIARQTIAAANDRLESDLADLADAERVIDALNVDLASVEFDRDEYRLEADDLQTENRRLIALLDAHGVRWQT